MEFSYQQGTFIEGDKVIEGEIILSEHKLYLRSPSGDLTETYIPLEKIERIKKSSGSLDVHVRPSITIRYVACFKGEAKHISSLAKELVSRRGLKKKFLRNEWVEVPT